MNEKSDETIKCYTNCNKYARHIARAFLEPRGAVCTEKKKEPGIYIGMCKEILEITITTTPTKDELWHMCFIIRHSIWFNLLLWLQGGCWRNADEKFYTFDIRHRSYIPVIKEVTRHPISRTLKIGRAFKGLTKFVLQLPLHLNPIHLHTSTAMYSHSHIPSSHLHYTSWLQVSVIVLKLKL